MTAPTPLAETIARLKELAEAAPKHRRRLSQRNDKPCVMVGQSDGSVEYYAWLGFEVAQADAKFDLALRDAWPLLLDAASERDALAKRLAGIDATEESGLTRPQLLDRVDALAKRVGELEARNEEHLKRRNALFQERNHYKAEARNLTAESTRLAELRAALTADQDRVRELEKLLENYRQEVARLGKELLHEIRANNRNTPGPITDQTQGVVTLNIRNDYLPAKPSCIPADCEHFEQLPSGLWAWVEQTWITVNIDDGPAYIQECMLTRKDAGLDGPCTFDIMTGPDFLSARALGVRVLGWKS